MKTDFQTLEELFDTVEQFKQRLGDGPKRGYLSSSRKLRKDVADFTGKCRNGELKGRARNRKSGELFIRIISLHSDVWRK
jgi:hypothetical protein